MTVNPTPSPFDDIRALMADLPLPDEEAGAPWDAARGGLGELADILAWLARWRPQASINRPVIALYAGSHAGRDEIGDLRVRMEAIAAGAAPVSRAAGHIGAGLDVFDLAIDRPVGDPAQGPTMSERECAATMAFGMEVLAKQPDVLALGALGEGAMISAVAIAKALEGESDGLTLLCRLGGRETAAIAGAIVAARTQRTPVILEGAAALAAAGVLHAADPSIIAHCRLGHALSHPQMTSLAARLGLTPLIDLKLTLEDGTGAAAALCLVKFAHAMGAEG